LIGDKVEMAEEVNTPEKRTDDILRKFDTDKDGNLSIEEFIIGARQDPSVVRLIQCAMEIC